MKFNEKLTVLRKSKGLTQTDFAKAIGTSRMSVYKWEHGDSYPEVPRLLEIKLIFGISIDDLLDDSYDIPLPEKKKKRRLGRAEREEIEKSLREEYENAPDEHPAEEAPAPAPLTEKTAQEPGQSPQISENPPVTPTPVSDSRAEAEEKTAQPEKEEPAVPKRKGGIFGRLFGKK